MTQSTINIITVHSLSTHKGTNANKKRHAHKGRARGNAGGGLECGDVLEGNGGCIQTGKVTKSEYKGGKKWPKVVKKRENVVKKWLKQGKIRKKREKQRKSNEKMVRTGALKSARLQI